MLGGTLPKFTSIATGELAGVTSATQLPDVPCRVAHLRAASDNAASVWIGVSTVTKPDGTTDVTTGLELAKGDPPLTLTIDNLNRLYMISASGDDLLYLVER